MWLEFSLPFRTVLDLEHYARAFKDDIHIAHEESSG